MSRDHPRAALGYSIDMTTRIAAFVIVSAMTTRSHAQPASASPALAPPSMVAPREVPTTAPATEWYGWQILIADGTMLGLAAATRSGGALYGWLGTGALVHWTHGNVGRGLASIGLRASLPLLGAYIGIHSAGDCHSDWCGFGEGLLGGFLGLATAEVLDVSLLGREPARRGPTISPVVRADDSSVRLGLAGQF